jgi:molybdate transport system substrate-binding protein
VFLLNVIQAPGLDVVGPFPPGLQREVVFVAALAANAHQQQAAVAFVDYLRSPAGVAQLTANGLNATAGAR